MDKLLISQNKAIQLLDTNSYLFKNFILNELETFEIGKRKKIVFQSLLDFISCNKTKPYDSNKTDYSSQIQESFCKPISLKNSPKKVRIIL